MAWLYLPIYENDPNGTRGGINEKTVNSGVI